MWKRRFILLVDLPSGWLMRFVPFVRWAAGRMVARSRWQQRLNDWEVGRFDRRLGVETTGTLVPMDATVRHGDASLGVVYAGTQPRLARWWLAALPRDRSEFTFVDMGSGKGRVLLYALEAGFGRAVGIEFAEELHEVAVSNARVAAARGLPIETILGDAAAFTFPDEPLVVHFNNPFHDPVMERVIANLTESYERRRRPIVVVYHQLTVEDPEDVTGNFGLLDDVPFLEGRTLAPPAGPVDRRFLAPFTVRIYESAEVVCPSAVTARNRG
jgi:SAM-dependent methyltransferase